MAISDPINSTAPASSLTKEQFAQRAGVGVDQITGDFGNYQVGPTPTPSPTVSPIPAPTSPISDTNQIRSNVADLNNKIANIGNSTVTSPFSGTPVTQAANGIWLDANGMPTYTPPTGTNSTTIPGNPTPPQFGNYTPDQLQQIENAGIGIANQYDALISKAQQDKAQGMAKNIVNAGERGGFMNTQFSGIGALQSTQGGDFVGTGGELNRLKSEYDFNINQLQMQKTAAVEQAKQAMRQYIDTGNQQAFENAQTAYQNAVAVADKQQQIALESQQQQIELKKASFDLSVPLSQAGDDIKAWAVQQLTQYPTVISDILVQGGTVNDIQNLSASQLAELISKDPTYQAIQAKSLAPDNQVIQLPNGQTMLINTQTGSIIKNYGGTSTISTASTANNNSQYATALQTILGSGKFTKDQTQSIINAINNGDDPVTVIKNQAKALLPATEASNLTKYEVAKQSMEDLQNALNEYYANGGKTNILSGNFEKVLNKLGTVNDPKLVEIATEIASNLQQYRNAVSGTAYSIQEGQEISSVFPGIDKTQGLNEAILAGRLNAFDSTIDNTYETVLGKAYDQLKESEFSGNNFSDEDLIFTVQQSASKYQDQGGRERLIQDLVNKGVPQDKASWAVYTYIPST